MITDLGNSFFLNTSSALITFKEPNSLFVKPENDPVRFKIGGKGKEFHGIAFWGKENKLPKDLYRMIGANPITASGAAFNYRVIFGGGVMIAKRDADGKLTPTNEFHDINNFFSDNDVNGKFLEMATDLWTLHYCFPEIICNNESSPRVVELNVKKATFSRLEVMNPKNGDIEHHFYSAKWGENANPDDLVASEMLSLRNPIKNLKYKLGIESHPLGLVKPSKERRFIIPITIPSPDRFYYPAPAWTSIIESGWYDFAQKIPEFKRALLSRGMVIKHHVEIHPHFFEKMFVKLGITDEKEKRAKQREWLTDLDNFLSKPENAGKSFVSEKIQVGDNLQSMVEINQKKNEFTGGEYLPDLEEVSNILSYGMEVHPSLIGSSPGKNKTINGTEARELFIIAQAMKQVYRDRLLIPFYLIKAINKWPEEAHFVIPNIELTTLDKGTGAKKIISQPAIDNF